jgi:CubicO group peptidase (beta-lactamase class C family)
MRPADLAVKEGLQGALQFCAYKDGKCIVDVWAGTMTTNAGAAKIDGDTLFPIFSTEKPLLATAMHRSVERGKLEYDKPVCKYWPEFRGGGKENLTVREMMGYRSGLPDCKSGIRWDDFPEFASLISEKVVFTQWRRGVGAYRPHNNLGIHLRMDSPSPSSRGFRRGCRAVA